MYIFQSLIKKEALHLLRDSRTITIVLFIPVVLLLLFGFAISTEVNRVKIIAVVEQHTDETRLIIDRFRVNPYYSFEGIVPYNKVESQLRKGMADAAVIFRTEDGKLKHQIIVDASSTTMAQTATAYLESAINSDVAGVPIVTDTLYNPQLKSAYNFVPGIMGLIFTLICAMMTSVSIVNEKETGTMNLLLVSPVQPSTIILGKLIPYFLLSGLILALILALSYTALEMPLSTNIIHVIWMTILYIVLALGLGLLISTIASTQVTALIISGMVLMIPTIMLSGMLFPIENMPLILQWISCLIPARWYISAMRVLMIQQLPIGHVLTEICVLSGITLGVLVLAIRMFNIKK